MRNLNYKKSGKAILAIAFAAVSLTSCVHNDDWSAPQVKCTNKYDAPTMTMAAFVAQAPATGVYNVTTDQIFDGYVVSSDESGNFYKTISIQDAPSNPTIGLEIDVNKSTNFKDFPVGAHLRINANGLIIGNDKGVVKLGITDPNYAIGRIPDNIIGRYFSGVCNGTSLDIQTIVPVALNNLAEAQQPKYINTLVSVPNVQFNIGDLYPVNKRYVDSDASGTTIDTSRNLEDSAGNTTILRTSGYSTFGTTLLPKKSGTITMVVSRYNSTYQMMIRDLNDIKFTNNRFDPTPVKGGTNVSYTVPFTETFESYTATNQDTFPKYFNDAVLGNRYWQVKTFQNNKYIQLGANSGSGPYDTYFIVPADMTAANTMSFKVNVGYWNGAALKVYYSTDYVPGGDVTSATLTDITSSFTIPTTPTNAYGTLVNAGTYNIPASVTGNGYFLFRYTGNGSGVTTTIQLDDITVN